MYTNSNSLGIGATGNTYNLVPNNIRIPQIINYNQPLPYNKQPLTSGGNYINQVSTPIQVNTPSQVEVTNQINTPHPQINQEIPDQVVHSSMDMEDSNHQIQSSPKQDINNVETHWNELFQSVCSNQLYGAFRKVKGIINNSSYFDDTRISYINYDAMQLLISKAKRERSKKGLMSLKTHLNMDKQNIVDFENIDSSLQLIHIMEILGPPDHALIALDQSQLEFLKKNDYHEYYWPNGNNGITWITKASSGNWNN